jgi:hypothetical protein
MYAWNDKPYRRKRYLKLYGPKKAHIINEDTGRTWCQIENTGMKLTQSRLEAPGDRPVCKNCVNVKNDTEPSLAVLMGERVS